jgi:hypothetical protein
MGDHSSDEGLSLIDGILPSELLNECEDENYGVEGKWNYLLMAFVVVKLRNPELGPCSQTFVYFTTRFYLKLSNRVRCNLRRVQTPRLINSNLFRKLS